jgi:hypothetical protein
VKTIKVLFLAIILTLSCISFSHAVILDFEGLSAYDWVPNGYGSLNWSNMNIKNPSLDNFSNTGYGHGLISGVNEAFNAWGTMAATSCVSSFNFNGVYLTSAWTDGLNIKVEGFNKGNLLYSQTVVVDSLNSTYFNFNYLGVDAVEFSSFGGVDHAYSIPHVKGSTIFVMDDFTFNVPEPATVLLLGLGLLGLTGMRRKMK